MSWNKSLSTLMPQIQTLFCQYSSLIIRLADISWADDWWMNDSKAAPPLLLSPCKHKPNENWFILDRSSYQVSEGIMTAGRRAVASCCNHKFQTQTHTFTVREVFREEVIQRIEHLPHRKSLPSPPLPRHLNGSVSLHEELLKTSSIC